MFYLYLFVYAKTLWNDFSLFLEPTAPGLIRFLELSEEVDKTTIRHQEYEKYFHDVISVKYDLGEEFLIHF